MFLLRTNYGIFKHEQKIRVFSKKKKLKNYKNLFNVDTCKENKSYIQVNFFKLILQKFPKRECILFF